MNTTQQYQTLDEQFGLSAVRDAMAVTAGEPDDEVILPQERLSRVMTRLRDIKLARAQNECPPEYDFCSDCHDHAIFIRDGEDDEWLSDCCSASPISVDVDWDDR